MIKVLEKDLKNNKKSYKKITLLSFLILLCVSIITIFGFTIDNFTAKEDIRNQSSNVIKVMGNQHIKDDAKLLENLKNIDAITETIYTARKLNLNGITDNKLINDFNLDKKITYKDPFAFQYLDKIPNAILNEFDLRNKNKSFFEFGKMFKAENEFVCTKSFLTSIGVTDFEKQIGNFFRIEIDGKTYLNANLTGIISNDIYNLSTYSQGINMPEVFMPTSKIDYLDVNTHLFLDNYVDSTVTKFFSEKEIEKFLPTNTSIVKVMPPKSLSVLFDFKMIAFNIVLGIGVIIIVYCLYTIFKTLLKNNKTLYEKENFDKKAKRKFATLQVLFINVAVFLFVMVLGIAWLYMFNAIINSVSGLGYLVNFNIYGIMVGILALATLVITVMLQALINLKN